MEKMKTTAVQPTPPTAASDKSAAGRAAFVSLALDMTWKLAFTVLVPIIAGVGLDKQFKTAHVFTFIGLGLALIGSTVVMWHTMQVANSLPVPKLSAAEKRKIQKQYEEDDADA